MEGMAGRKPALVWAVNLSAAFLVLLWLIPTIGLFVTSFRDKDQIIASGWWNAFFSSVQTARFRTDPATQRQDGATWVIEGVALPEGAEAISAWGTRTQEPAANPPGATVELDGGVSLTVNGDGTYRLTSPAEFDDDQRIFVQATVPPKFTLSGYERVLTGEGIDRAFFNTATVAIPATIIPILMAAFAAYALAWMDFRARGFLIAVIVGLLVVPLQLALIPMKLLHSSLGIQGYLGVWLAHSGFGLPLAIYLLRNYMAGLPRDIIENARVDGATEFQIFFKIILPLSFPALASFSIFQFLWTWNDLLVAKVFLPSKEQEVLTVGISKMMGSKGGEWDLLAVAGFVSIVVPLIVFFALQRFLVRGLLAGSVK
jgi:alpha-glucoside transport system permease protein